MSQFYLHTPRSSANGMNHTCVFLPSRSWYLFTDPRGMEGWVGHVVIDVSVSLTCYLTLFFSFRRRGLTKIFVCISIYRHISQFLWTLWASHNYTRLGTCSTVIFQIRSQGLNTSSHSVWENDCASEWSIAQYLGYPEVVHKVHRNSPRGWG